MKDPICSNCRWYTRGFCRLHDGVKRPTESCNDYEEL